MLLKIGKLSNQIKIMEPSPQNLRDALLAICEILSSIQRELDDLDDYKMEQKEYE